jgi:hypothetical protein
MAIVVTADQRGSRTGQDAVPETLERLRAYRRRDGLLRRFERTAGDEIQGLLSSPQLAVSIVTDLALTGTWAIGVGVGPVEEPLPSSTRAARGPAFVQARAAVTRAPRQPQPVSVIAYEPRAGDAVEAAWWMLLALLNRRTEAGWEAVAMVEEGATHAQVGSALGISPQAVSQRLRAAGYVEGRRGAALVADLLDQADRA